jgi:glycosyltransferase involved in cell wall biosynthesis
METVSIIIPVKDEQLGLEFLFNEFNHFEKNINYKIEFIFVIDERTNDLSKQIAKRFSKNIIDQKDTHGKGAAIKQAIEFWKKKQSDYIVFMDADGSYSFGDISNLILLLEKGNDIVSGSRFMNQDNNLKEMGKLHYLGNIILSKISGIKNRRKITDLCTGFWAFNSSTINALEIKSNGFDLEAELMGKVRRLKLRHVEMGVSWTQRKGGVSKLRSFRDGMIILIRILRT